jgi:putative membrane protein
LSPGKMSSPHERVLILAVDRDGDLERKTRVRTPIWGRDALMSAATALAVADPEEADANALFGAIKEYDKLRSQEIDCEVGVVCGLEESGFKADRKIRREVEALLSRQQYLGIVLISDGAEDELIIPILQNLKPIVSVRRVVVKHSRSVEENYMVLGRYLRMLVFEPRYSKWVIGVPGVILLLAGVLVLAGEAYLATLAVLLIIGAAFLVRGFNVDRFIAGMIHSKKPYGYIRLFTVPTSLLILIVGLSSGYNNMSSVAEGIIQSVKTSPILFLSYGGVLIGYYLQGSLLLIWTAIGIYLAGTLLTQFLRGSSRAWRSITGIVVLALLFLPMDEFSTYLVTGGASSSILLITYVLVGLAAVFGLVITLYTRLRTRPPLSTDPASGPSLRADDSGQHPNDDDQDVGEERQD